MLYIYGDSHARFSFKNLQIHHENKAENSVTMHRIGRDNTIIHFDKTLSSKDNTFCFIYGEVDCRCHIYHQIQLGRNQNDIITELVDKYFQTIRNNIIEYKQIIITAVIPPQSKQLFEKVHGPVQHEFPFLGTDEERIVFTSNVNKKLKEYCDNYHYTFFDPYEIYKNDTGLLKYEMSDTACHLQDNSKLLNLFLEIL